jgi:hypothetical protein
MALCLRFFNQMFSLSSAEIGCLLLTLRRMLASMPVGQQSWLGEVREEA